MQHFSPRRLLPPRRKIVGLLFSFLSAVVAFGLGIGAVYAAVTIGQYISIGSGTPDLALGDGDLYVTGTTEVDGAARFDGAATFNATSTFNSDLVAKTGGAATFVVAASDASTRMKNQADYVADGTADDVEIQTAIDALPASGGKVVLSEGTFTGGQLSIPSNTQLVGQGNATTYTLAASTDTDAIVNSDPTNGNTDIVLRDFVLDGNKANQGATSKGIYFKKVQRVKIVGLHIKDTQDRGIHTDWPAAGGISGTQDTLITDTIVEDAGHHGFHVRGERIIVTNSTSIRSQQIGFLALGASEVILQNLIALDSNQSGSAGKSGIALEGTVSENVVIDGCVIVGGGSDTNGIVTESGHDIDSLIISNNVIDEVTRYGIQLNAKKALITGNQIRGAGIDGIFVFSEGVSILGNHIIASNRSGITIQGNNVIVENNRVLNNDQGALSREGIRLENVSGTLVQGNKSLDDQATKTQNYGIREIGSSDNNWIINNDVADNETTNIVTTGANTVVRQNKGHVTESSGTATIASGATSTTVAHGLAVTPTANDCSINPTNNLGTATKFWADTFGASNFTINVDADPGASTATFAWTCQVL